jgi:hypothetical protein
MPRVTSHDRTLLRASLALLLLSAACAKRLDDPLRPLAEELDRYPQYSVVLQDMDVSGTFFKSYHHLYKVIYGEEQEGEEDLLFQNRQTPWTEVSKRFYETNRELLGMVLLSKGPEGKVVEDQFPPGYQYVGNPRYGQWRNDSSGNSFWEFYGKYALFRDVLGLATLPLYRSHFDSYSDHRRRGEPFFGPTGAAGRTYGTGGSYTRKTQPTFYERQQARQSARRASFSDKVQSRTGTRSRSATRSGK